MCVDVVLSVMQSRMAISDGATPSTSRPSTSRSRGVSADEPRT